MFTSRRKFGWVAAVLLLAGSLYAQNLTEQNGRYVAEISKTFAVTSGGTLSVRGISGDVKLTAWDKASVEIRETARLKVFTRAEAEEILQRLEGEISQNGNQVGIDGGDEWEWADRQLEISLPTQFTVMLRISDGDVTLRGVSGSLELRTSHGDVEVADAGGTLDIHTSAGNLEVLNLKGRLDAKTSGGNIRIANVTEDAMLNTSGGNIRVNDVQKALTARTSGGEIEIRNAGGNVEARTSGGNISLQSCAGDAVLRTSGGDIDAETIAGNLEAKTSGGEVNGNNIAGRVDAATSGGDINFRNVRGAVRAATSAGDVEVEITLTDFKQDHRIYLESSSGTIRLYLPEKLPATISAEIRRNSRWNRNEIYSDFPLSGEDTGSERTLRKRGDINGGGDEIILETTGGDIYIKRNRR